MRRAGAETEDSNNGAEELARIPVFPLAVFPVIFPCLYYLTHADLRYRHPIDPVVLLLTAIAVAGAWNAVVGDASEGNKQVKPQEEK